LFIKTFRVGIDVVFWVHKYCAKETFYPEREVLMYAFDRRNSTLFPSDECMDKELLENMMISHTLMRMFIRSKGLCSEFLSWRSALIEGNNGA
jgi:hypothetical protein